MCESLVLTEEQKKFWHEDNWNNLRVFGQEVKIKAVVFAERGFLDGHPVAVCFIGESKSPQVRYVNLHGKDKAGNQVISQVIERKELSHVEMLRLIRSGAIFKSSSSNYEGYRFTIVTWFERSGTMFYGFVMNPVEPFTQKCFSAAELAQGFMYSLDYEKTWQKMNSLVVVPDGRYYKERTLDEINKILKAPKV